jgi:hypothetical protein
MFFSLSGTEWTQTKSYFIDGIRKYCRGQELQRESRDRPWGWVVEIMVKDSVEEGSLEQPWAVEVRVIESY